MGTTEVRITLSGTNTLSDTAGNTAKSVISLARRTTIGGSGTLTLTALLKNGIKCDGKLFIESGTILVPSAVNTAISADDQLVINGGKLTLTTTGDAIKSSPKTLSADSAGDVIINGGEITVASQQDAISADHNAEINGGTFNIKTYGGYYVSVCWLIGCHCWDSLPCFATVLMWNAQVPSLVLRCAAFATLSAVVVSH